MKGWLSKAWRWRLRSRADGVWWSVVFSLVSVPTYYLGSGFLGVDAPVAGAVGIGLGALIGGLLATLYWLPKENGS